MAKVIAEIVGRLATMLGYDGTAFRNFGVDTNGHLYVRMADAESNVRPQGIDVADDWHPLVVTNTGELIVSLSSTFENHVVCTGTYLADFGPMALDDDRHLFVRDEDMAELLGALNSVNTDKLMVEVESSALPNGAATATNQTAILDRVKRVTTRFNNRIYGTAQSLGVGAGTRLVGSSSPIAGQIWLIQQVGASNQTSVCTEIIIGIQTGGVDHFVKGETNPPIWHVVNGEGPFIVEITDTIRCSFRGCTAGDNLKIWWTGWDLAHT